MESCHYRDYYGSNTLPLFPGARPGPDGAWHFKSTVLVFCFHCSNLSWSWPLRLQQSLEIQFQAKIVLFHIIWWDLTRNEPNIQPLMTGLETETQRKRWRRGKGRRFGFPNEFEIGKKWPTCLYSPALQLTRTEVNLSNSILATSKLKRDQKMMTERGK